MGEGAVKHTVIINLKLIYLYFRVKKQNVLKRKKHCYKAPSDPSIQKHWNIQLLNKNPGLVREDTHKKMLFLVVEPLLIDIDQHLT